MKKVQELVSILNKYVYEYYVLDMPSISDSEFDRLYDELVELEKSTGVILPDSPTQRVGDEPLKRFTQHTHRQRLYSLDKAQSIKELAAFFNRVKNEVGFLPDFTLEHKFDGLTLSLTYDKGYLVSAATRGNGQVGEEVTTQIKTIKTIPLSIAFKGLIEIQGEGIMKFSALDSYNATHDIPLKNARNAAAGAIRNLDPKETAKRNLDFFAYNVSYIEEKVFKTQEDVRNFLFNEGFLVGDEFSVVDDLEKSEEVLLNIDQNKDSLDFLIDGAVFKVNDISLREKLGYTQKFPKWAIAYKFKAEEVVTLLKDVIWQVSRTGKINPLAILEPVELAGATIRRATLNNIEDIEKKGIKIGSEVLLRRSNDVIPEILGVHSHKNDSMEIHPPIVCPSCGTAVRREGPFYFCDNTSKCAPIIIDRIVHFASKEGMDIEGLSEKTAEQLFNDLKIDRVDKIYSLSKKQLLTLDGFKSRKAENLLNAISKSKNTTLSRLIYALGIPTIGVKASRELEKEFKNLNNLFEVTEEQIKMIPDFGDIMASSVITFFADEKNKEIIQELMNYGISILETKTASSALKDRVFVFTGSLGRLSREEASKLVKNFGGEVSSTVSKKVNTVVYGENAGSKLKRAHELGVRTIDEASFLKMIEEISSDNKENKISKTELKTYTKQEEKDNSDYNVSQLNFLD